MGDKNFISPQVRHSLSKSLLVITICLSFSYIFSLGFNNNSALACDHCTCHVPAHGVQRPIPPDYNTTNYCSSNWGGYDPGTTTPAPPDTRGNDIRCVIRDEHQYTTDHMLEEFEDTEEFWINLADPLDTSRVFGYMLPAFMMMTEQFVHVAMMQTFMIGSMLDAKMSLEAQAVFQKLHAKAHQDYHPSHSMCVIGTNMRSLAQAENNYEFTTYVLSQRSIDRQMGNMYAAAARGQFQDHCMRLRQFRRYYCYRHDNNDQMDYICDPVASNPEIGGIGDIAYEECIPDSFDVTEIIQNKDISYARTIDSTNTLDIDFYTPAGGVATDDERDVFALASNLYSHDIMYRIPETALRMRDTQAELTDMRSVIAKRSVAEHSFNTIVGMKAQSKDEALTLSQPYMLLILESLGLGGANPFAAEEIAMYLGERPSYYAQMELLTKRIFQSPDFFVNLYDEPTNVERMGVSLQAIGLMQDFDTWNSYLRTEALLSVILELELMRINKQVINQMGDMRSGGFEL